MTLRLFIDEPLRAGTTLTLPPPAAQHARVRRVQPGDTLYLFDGSGSEWAADVLAMGRSDVRVQVGAARAVERELPWPVTLAIGMPANERMDGLVEKATELGVTRVQPLVCERSVLRLAGERARRKQVHWQAVAIAACEQCGRARLPVIEPVATLADWLAAGRFEGRRLTLSPDAQALRLRTVPHGAVCALSGPEGGLTAIEEASAAEQGFEPVGLGPRVLRADTAPLALLAWLAAGA